MKLTKEQVEVRRKWWLAHFDRASVLAEEREFWNSEITLCDMALSSLDKPAAVVCPECGEAPPIHQWDCHAKLHELGKGKP